MAINIVRGFYGLTCVGCYYLGIRDGIVASRLSNKANIIPEDPDAKNEGYHEFANRTAKAMGLNKEITVIKGDGFHHFGNNLFSLRAGIQIDLNEPDEVIETMISHEIAHLKANDTLTWTFVPLIISIFTTVILNSRAPIAACLAGLATGVISHIGLRRWREKEAYLAAMKYWATEKKPCPVADEYDSDVDGNTIFLDWLKNHEKEQTSAPFIKKCINYFINLNIPSYAEVIRYYEDHPR